MSVILLPGYGNQAEPIRVGVKHEPPFVIRESGQAFSGLSVDLWKSIAEEQGVSYEIVEYNDHLGLIRALDFGDIDITINPIHVSEVRMKLLDVTQPFFVSSIGVATTQLEKSQVGVFINNFFSIQFLRLVLFLSLTIFIFGTILWLVERRHNRRQFRSGLMGLFDGLWWSAVTMTTVGYGDKAPKTKFGRVIAMAWMFFAIILISGFTGTIASTLTVSSLSRNIEDLEDLRNSENIGSIFASSSENFLKQNKIGIDALYADAQKSLLALPAGEIEVLVYDKTALDYLINKMQLSSKVSLLPVNFNQQYRSFILTKGSEHLEWINPLLVRKINEPSWQEVLNRYSLQVEK